jgi:FAD/FMN-containing dehydrogenase
MKTADLGGRLVTRGEPGYEQARVGRVFNGRRPERYPDAVLLAGSEADVVAGVRLAAERGWTVAVRSGGHSWAAWSVRDGGLLIDLGAMRDMVYHPATAIAAVRPAVRGGLDLAPFLAERGRAFPGGHCASVGLGGYLLQGGQGWNGRDRGWACESVVGLDLVTAAGDLVYADADHDADLLWAARGAGPGFPGVITRFHLQTYRAPAVMWQDTWTFRLADTGPLLGWLHDMLSTLDRRVEPVLAATRQAAVPLHAGVDRPQGIVLLLHTTVMADSDEQARELLAPLWSGPLAASALGHDCGPTSVLAENEAQTAQNPDGHRYAADCTWTDAPAEVLAPLLSRMWSELAGASYSIWYGWAPRRTLPDMAFSVEANVYIATYALWTDPAADDRHRDWLHRRTAALAEHGAGAYLGDTDFTRRQDRFLSDSAYARLGEIRDRWDPDRRFASWPTADADGLNVHAV